MENASKALLIAGGMLLTMMIMAMLISLGISISDVAESQDKNQLTKQIQEFNKGYEAYNKTKMFGIDVITVTNKAINHNKTIAATETEAYYVNIKIKTNQTFETIVMETDNTKIYGEQKRLKGANITTNIKNLLGNPSNNYGAYLDAGVLYELGVWQNNGESFIMNNNFIQFFEGDTIDKTVTTPDKKKTYTMYSALTNFKIAVFECSEIEYEEGRVSSMTFIEI